MERVSFHDREARRRRRLLQGIGVGVGLSRLTFESEKKRASLMSAGGSNTLEAHQDQDTRASARSKEEKMQRYHRYTTDHVGRAPEGVSFGLVRTESTLLRKQNGEEGVFCMKKSLKSFDIL